MCCNVKKVQNNQPLNISIFFLKKWIFKGICLTFLRSSNFIYYLWSPNHMECNFNFSFYCNFVLTTTWATKVGFLVYSVFIYYLYNLLFSMDFHENSWKFGMEFKMKLFKKISVNRTKSSWKFTKKTSFL